MIKAKRKTDLLSYLPPFLREYDETEAALNAENPEFELLWEQAKRTLDSGFIDTAEEYGIRRFERLMGILPEAGADLEARRSVIRARWLSKLPYTYRMLLKRLEAVCGEDFSAAKSFEEDYFLRVVTHLREQGKITEVKKLLDEMLPANMRFDHYNSVTFKADKNPVLYAGVKSGGKHKRIAVSVNRF
ncbi:MAG: YmfQ family protein [Bacteroides sp.]|nr:YmfQ family protein [Bacteroides sp.]